ncbi:MAG TPA: tetratricopeptide repeat-containing sensor histidine kinase [Chryseosolibacter sp.]
MPLKRLIITAFLSVIIFSCLSQSRKIDSLESLVHSVPSDTTKVWLLNQLVDALREKDNNKAYTYAQQASELAELLNYKNGQAIALENLGWSLYRKGDFSKSLEVSTQALKLSEEIGDRHGVARCLINMAAINYEQKRYEGAITYFKDAYVTASEVNDLRTMARCYNNIAYTFRAMEQIDSAEVFANKALVLSNEAKQEYLTAFAMRTLGDVALARNAVKEALRHYFSCYDIAIKIDNTFLKSSVLHRIAKSYNSLKKYDEALNYLHENIAVAKKSGFKDELERAYKLLSEIYYSVNDLKQAYHYQSLYVGLHDSLYDQRGQEQIAMMQIRFETEMKQAQIELLTKDAELKAKDINRKQVWIYFYVGCLSLLCVLAFVFYYNNRHNRNARISLQQKNREIQHQTLQLRNLNSTKDKLFSIISHDLRSPVASLKALMEIVNTTGLSQEEFVEITKVLKRNLDSVYDDLDNLLLWAQTQLRGLTAARENIDLRQIADEKVKLFSEHAERKQLKIANEIPEGLVVHADKNHIGLVFRNLLANAVKFNRANGNIRITATENEDDCEVSIIDSGVGISESDLQKLFNPETHFTTPGTHKEKGMGIGLLLTKEFLEKNGGTIRVSSRAGVGTTFTFSLRMVKQSVEV